MKRYSLLNTNINIINLEEATNHIIQHAEALHGEYICVSNVHTTVMSYENAKYNRIQNNSYMTLPDGMPLCISGKLKGFNNIGRVTGPDLMSKIFESSSEYGYTHYFYGSSQHTLDTLEKRLKTLYPDINIVGTFSPPFRPLSEVEDLEIIKKIKAANPTFLWVGLGAPKQEIWMEEHANIFNSLMIGVGAGFDYHAGLIDRAPRVMQKLSLEWLYRLIQEPKRLFRRYMITNFKFLYYIVRNKVNTTKGSK